MSPGISVEVGDVVGHPEARREFSGTQQVSLRLGEVVVNGPMAVDGVVRGTTGGVIVHFAASAPGRFACVRCLAEWDELIAMEGMQHYGKVPDEDGYAIEDRHIDISSPATDELALALPAAPLCRNDCKGLCPICGTDLNGDPCDGHGDESDSPFAVLKDLFDT